MIKCHGPYRLDMVVCIVLQVAAYAKTLKLAYTKKYLEFLRTLCTAVCTICYYFLIVGELFVGFVQDHPIHNFYLSSLETDPIGQILTMP